jgi:hypothetical protein
MLRTKRVSLIVFEVFSTCPKVFTKLQELTGYGLSICTKELAGLGCNFILEALNSCRSSSQSCTVRNRVSLECLYYRLFANSILRFVLGVQLRNSQTTLRQIHLSIGIGNWQSIHLLKQYYLQGKL